MPHGHCRDCEASVTVRNGRCLLGHPIDPATITRARGRHRTSGRRKHRGRTSDSRSRATPVLGSPPPPPAIELGRTVTPSPVGPAEQAAIATQSRIEIAPTGTLVVELWNATGDEEVMAGWEPTSFDPDRRNLRHRLFQASVVLLVLAILGAGSWLFTGRRDLARREAVAAVTTSATRLASVADHVELATADLADGDLADPLFASTQLAELDGAARALFGAASALDPTLEGELRMQALTASQQALDIETAVGDAVAYAGTFELISSLPSFPSAAGTDDVATVAADVAWWVSRFDEGASALPRHPLLNEHRREVLDVADGLEQWQAEYLDALRSGDEAAANERLDEMTRRLEQLKEGWISEVETVGEWTTEAVAVLEQRLLSLSG